MYVVVNIKTKESVIVTVKTEIARFMEMSQRNLYNIYHDEPYLEYKEYIIIQNELQKIRRKKSSYPFSR